LGIISGHERSVFMQSAYVIDPNFNYEQTVKSILSIRYAADGFSFCVHDEQDKLVVFAHQACSIDLADKSMLQVKNYIASDPWLQQTYQRVYLMACSQDKNLIPASFVHEEVLPYLYSFSQEIGQEDRMLHHALMPIDACLLEAFPAAFLQFLWEKYPGAHVTNGAYPFIYHAFSKMLSHTDQLFVDLQHQYLDVLLLRNARLQLFSTFNYQTASDIAYYILKCLKECAVEQEKVCVVVSGLVAKSSKLKELLASYLPALHDLQEQSLQLFLKDKQFDTAPFIHLLNLHRCGL